MNACMKSAGYLLDSSLVGMDAPKMHLTLMTVRVRGCPEWGFAPDEADESD